jgi:hypothetical protein
MGIIDNKVKAALGQRTPYCQDTAARSGIGAREE